MDKILVTGSIAYDNLMEFPGDFKESMENSKSNSLSFSFLVKNLKKARGGTAPNISYNLALFGCRPDVLGAVGCDFNDYKEWLAENNVGTDNLKIIDNEYTACCFVTTDDAQNQITSFYPGAMNYDTELSIKDLNYKDYGLVVIAPTMPEAMRNFTNECIELKIPYMYDPGMQIPRIEREDLKKGLINSKMAVFNDCEYDMILRKTRLTKEEILNKIEMLIVTRGEEGITLYRKNEEVHVPVVKANKVVDPTGAGDAARAGIVKGYMNGCSLRDIGRLATITAVYAVEHKGATNHKYSEDEINKRFRNNYGDEIFNILGKIKK